MMDGYEFFQEESGPSTIEQDGLYELDDQAMIKEITRLTKMEIVELVNVSELVDYKILTTKLVHDWRA